MLEQPCAELGCEHPQHRLVQDSHVRLARGEKLFQSVAVGVLAGQLHVHARGHAPQCGLLHGLLHVLVLVGVGYAAVIADCDACKAHLLPQQPGEQLPGGVDRLPIDEAVTGHHAPQPTLGNGRLEGFPVDFLQLPGGGQAVGAMDAALGVVKGQKMLGSPLGLPPGCLFRLQTLEIGGAHSRHQGGVFPVGLSVAAHAGLPGHIQHRGQGLGDAAGSLLPADHPAQLFFQGCIPAGAPGNPRRQAYRALDKGPAKSLHVEGGWNMVGAVLHDDFLDAPLPGAARLLGVELPHLQGAHLADAVFRHPRNRFPIFPIGTKGEDAPHLGHLFRQAQLLQQSLGPLLWRAGCIKV